MIRVVAIILCLLPVVAAIPHDAAASAAGPTFGGVWEMLHGTQEQRNYEKAVAILERLSESDYAPAVYSLALCYFDGTGVPQSRQKAFELFMRASERGYPPAQNMLATMYEIGQGCEQDDKQAFHWYHKAAMSGNSAAQYNLGRMYQFGYGTQVDLAEAYVWHSMSVRYTQPPARNRPSENFKRELAARLTPEQIKAADERVERLARKVPTDRAHHNRLWRQQAGL